MTNPIILLPRPLTPADCGTRGLMARIINLITAQQDQNCIGMSRDLTFVLLTLNTSRVSLVCVATVVMYPITYSATYSHNRPR